MKKVLIIGAGPAGLTAAYELLEKSKEYEVTIFEESHVFGGISRTVNYKENRMNMGGHRFFSKMPEINDWWQKMLPLQGNPSSDDRILGRKIPFALGGPDPEKADEVMLMRTGFQEFFLTQNFLIILFRLNFQH